MGRRIRYQPTLSAEPTGVVEAAPDMSLFTPILIAGVGVIWVVVLAAMVWMGFFMRQNRTFQNEFTPLIDVCRGRWMEEASPYSPTPGKHPAVAVRDDSAGLQLDPYLIPSQVLAESVAETQVVLCLGKVETAFIETCSYIDPGCPKTSADDVRYSIHRYYYRQGARLVEVATGRVVAIESFTGKAPPYCQNLERFRDGKQVVSAMGTEVPESEIQAWASAHLDIK